VRLTATVAGDLVHTVACTTASSAFQKDEQIRAARLGRIKAASQQETIYV
jgi:hypothetical protein